MWDQGSKGWGLKSQGWDLGSQPRDRGSQAMGSGSAVFRGIRDQAVQFLWDQGPKFDTLLESRIRNLGTKMYQRWKNIPRYDPTNWFSLSMWVRVSGILLPVSRDRRVSREDRDLSNENVDFPDFAGDACSLCWHRSSWRDTDVIH